MNTPFENENSHIFGTYYGAFLYKGGKGRSLSAEQREKEYAQLLKKREFVNEQQETLSLLVEKEFGKHLIKFRWSKYTWSAQVKCGKKWIHYLSDEVHTLNLLSEFPSSMIKLLLKYNAQRVSLNAELTGIKAMLEMFDQQMEGKALMKKILINKL